MPPFKKYIFLQLYGISVDGDVHFKQKVKTTNNRKPNSLRNEMEE